MTNEEKASIVTLFFQSLTEQVSNKMGDIALANTPAEVVAVLGGVLKMHLDCIPHMKDKVEKRVGFVR